MKLAFLVVVIFLVGCKVDFHFDSDTVVWYKPMSEKPKPVPAEAPIPTEEFTTSYLDDVALDRAKAHGWEIVSVDHQENGDFYHLRRKIMDREEHR